MWWIEKWNMQEMLVVNRLLFVNKMGYSFPCARLTFVVINLCNIVITCVLQKNNIILCAARRLSRANEKKTHTHTQHRTKNERGIGTLLDELSGKHRMPCKKSTDAYVTTTTKKNSYRMGVFNAQYSNNYRLTHYAISV